jgi:hypothetical protein
LVYHPKTNNWNFGSSPKIEVSILKIALYKMPLPHLLAPMYTKEEDNFWVQSTWEKRPIASLLTSWTLSFVQSYMKLE